MSTVDNLQDAIVSLLSSNGPMNTGAIADSGVATRGIKMPEIGNAIAQLHAGGRIRRVFGESKTASKWAVVGAPAIMAVTAYVGVCYGSDGAYKRHNMTTCRPGSTLCALPGVRWWPVEILVPATDPGPQAIDPALAESEEA